MRQRKNFKDEGHPGWVWKLEKFFYGLKQASRLWNKKMDSFLVEGGYKRLNCEPCIYVETHKNENGEGV